MTRFSLVLATIDRTNELERFLSYLDLQTHRRFELIVVDQNEDERLTPVLEPYESKFSIRRCVSEPGLSRARNVGLKCVTGDVVAFPDDDCWYPPNLLRNVADFLEDCPELGGITVRCESRTGQDGGRLAAKGSSVGAARFDKRAGPLNKANVWLRACSYGIFLRRNVVEEVGGFDESLGVGAGTPWEGGEDIDYPLRAVEAGFEIYYRPDLFVLHPAPPVRDYSLLADRAYRYSAGIGRVWQKHDYPFWLVVYHLLRPLGGACLSLAKGRREEALYYLQSLRGRLAGWRSS
jgi:glycosyltransferase involved in cell wall biosynthesis